jgi:hypothetical protein
MVSSSKDGAHGRGYARRLLSRNPSQKEPRPHVDLPHARLAGQATHPRLPLRPLDILEDSFAAAEDITRDENDRTLGRLAAREAILAAHTMAKTMVTRAIESAGRETSGGLLN